MASTVSPNLAFDLKSIEYNDGEFKMTFPPSKSLLPVKEKVYIDMKDHELLLTKGGNGKIFAFNGTFSEKAIFHVNAVALSLFLHHCEEEECKHDTTPHILVMERNYVQFGLPYSHLLERDCKSSKMTNEELYEASVRTIPGIECDTFSHDLKGVVALVQHKFTSSLRADKNVLDVVYATAAYTQQSVPAFCREIEACQIGTTFKIMPLSKIKEDLKCFCLREQVLFEYMEINENGWISWTE